MWLVLVSLAACKQFGEWTFLPVRISRCTHSASEWVSERVLYTQSWWNFFALIYHKLYQIITALCRWCIVASTSDVITVEIKIVYISAAMKVYRWFGCCHYRWLLLSGLALHSSHTLPVLLVRWDAFFIQRNSCESIHYHFFYHLMSDELFGLSNFTLETFNWRSPIERHYSYFLGGCCCCCCCRWLLPVLLFLLEIWWVCINSFYSSRIHFVMIATDR